MMPEEPQYESWAERRFFPYVEQIAKETGLDFEYQHSVKWTSYATWVEWHSDDESDDYDEGYDSPRKWRLVDGQWEHGRYIQCEEPHTYEKYRLDFVLKGNGIKIDLEVDGKRWHDNEKDRKRDRYMESAGYRVIRVAAKEVNKDPLSLAIRIKNEIKMLQWEAVQ